MGTDAGRLFLGFLDMVAAIIPDVVHNMMIELRWQTVADRILVWLEEREVVKHGDAAEQGGARRRVDSIK